jgi:hypothetical protein
MRFAIFLAIALTATGICEAAQGTEPAFTVRRQPRLEELPSDVQQAAKPDDVQLKFDRILKSICYGCSQVERSSPRRTNLRVHRRHARKHCHRY